MDSMWYNQSILSVFGKFFKDNVLEVFEHLNEDDVQKLMAAALDKSFLIA